MSCGGGERGSDLKLFAAEFQFDFSWERVGAIAEPMCNYHEDDDDDDHDDDDDNNDDDNDDDDDDGDGEDDDVNDVSQRHEHSTFLQLPSSSDKYGWSIVLCIFPAIL